MGLSCRCCKKKGRCACKACPTIASESLAVEIDYQQFDINGQPFDGREDVPNGPLFGPEPPYPTEYEINATCGYPKPKITSDLEEGKCPDPENPTLECGYQYDLYTCEANGPRMGRVGPSKKSTFVGIGLIPENRDLIDCTDGGNCPQGYECVASTDPPEKIPGPKPPLSDPTPCDDVVPCPPGYECQCGNCEPEKIDAPIKSFCELERTPCSMRVPCPEGYECVTNPDTGDSLCEPISGELTKDFLQHPIQAQFGLYPCKNPHKNEVCAPLDDPDPCDIPDCVAPIGKLPDQCEKCTDGACQDHFGTDYKCNRNGDCVKDDSNPCPDGFECKLDPANPIVEPFPSEIELPFGYIGCTDTDCETEFGPGFQCNGNDKCEKDPADGTDENCAGLFGDGYEYYPTQPMKDGSGNKYVCDLGDPDAQSCEQLTGDPNSICEDGECHEIVPSCQKIRTNCLPISKADEPDWVFQENDGLPVFLVPTDGLPYGPLPLDGEGGTRKRRYDELWKDYHIGACNEIDVNNDECSPDCCYETFGDPWLPNHKWICKERTIKSLDPITQACGGANDPPCPPGYKCENGNCEPDNIFPTPINCDNGQCPNGYDCNPNTDLCEPKPCGPGNTPCPTGYDCKNGKCEPRVLANPDAGPSCYLEPIDPYSNKEDNLDSLVRDFPEFRELECPSLDPDQNCGQDGDEPCPDDYICDNGKCKFDCEAEYGPGAECVDLVDPGNKEDRWCQPPCSDDVCEEEYGVGFKCNNDGDCELVRDRDLDSRIPKPIGEKPTVAHGDPGLYFGHTTLWGGKNDTDFGVGVFNIDTTKVRTRLYLDYGYHLHYPFDKGHMDTELVPSGCAVDKTPKTDVWKYKGNKGHRHPYPKVNTMAIGNRYPSTHSLIDDEEGVDDFTKVGSGPYFAEYCDRLAGNEEPGGLLGLGDPAPTNWNPETKTHENDEYSPKKDPDGVVKGCDPSFVVPCDKNPSAEIEFDYLDYVRNEDMMEEDGLNRTGVCKKDMDDWRVSNQSVFSHNQVPSGPVGGLIIDKVEFVPVDYHFPAHTTSPDLWLWSGLTEYGWIKPFIHRKKNNRVLIQATTLPVYMAVYYNSKIGREPIRYDRLDINQFLPPPNGWLENIWQLGDIANPLDVENIQPNGAVTYSRPAGSSAGSYERKGYKYWGMTNGKYLEEYDHLPKDRHWDMPSEETCVDPKQNIEISCADKVIKTRWVNTGYTCLNGDCDDAVNDPNDPVQCIEGMCYTPPTDNCTNQKCNDLYDEDGDSFRCHGVDGDECIGRLCPDGYTCGPPDNDNMVVHPLPSNQNCNDPDICDQFGEDYGCVDSQVIPAADMDLGACWKDEQCVEETGIPGSTCNGDGDCVTPPTCQKPNRFCTPIDACKSDPGQGFLSTVMW